MYFYQYVYIAIVFLLLIPKASRLGAFIFLLSFLIYFPFIMPIDDGNYYRVSALKDFIMGFVLIRWYFGVGFLSFVLILANSYGFMIYDYGLDPDSYDIVCFIIITLQIILLSMRGLLNGVYRTTLSLWLVRLIDFDGNQSRVTMRKNTPEKETNK